MTKRDKALMFAWNYFYGRAGMEYSEEDVIALADAIMVEEQHSSNYKKMLTIFTDYEQGKLDGGFQQLKLQVLELIVQMESEKAQYVKTSSTKGLHTLEHICQSQRVDKSVIEPLLLEIEQILHYLWERVNQIATNDFWHDYTSAMNKLKDALNIPS